MTALLRFFVERPRVVDLLVVVALVGGVLAGRHLKYEAFPKIDVGAVNITTFRPGAGAEDVELSLTIPLEKEVLEVDGLAKVTSASMEGMSVITARIDPDVADQRRVLADLQKAVDRGTAFLPSDLEQRPVVDELSTDRMPVIEVHVLGAVPEATLREVARQLSDGIRELPGISGVERIGFRDREVRILLDPDRLQHLAISYQEIIDAIERRNVRDAGGSIDSFVAEKKVLTVGQFSHPKEVGDVIVRSAGPGNMVRLRDLAEVVLDYEDWTVQSRLDGTQDILLLVRKKGSADGIDTARRVREYVGGVRAGLPPGMRVALAKESAHYTRQMLGDLRDNAVLGFALVFAVLFAFFSLRMAFWVAAGLPVTLCLTAVAMAGFGIGVNVLTLTAFVLMLGMLVDDSIVTGESIASQREAGLAPREAAVRGARRVAPPVFASSLTTALAFLPLAFLGGVEGKFFLPIAVVVAVALGTSLLECKLFLPAHLAKSHVLAARRWFDAAQGWHRRVLRVSVRHRWATLAVFLLGSAAVAAVAAAALRFDLYPQRDIDEFHIKVELPQGASFAHAAAKVAELEQLVRDVVPPGDLLDVASQIGHHDTDTFGATEGRSSAWAVVKAYLRSQRLRRRRSSELIAELRRRCSRLEGYQSLIVASPNDANRGGKPVEVEVVGNGPRRFDTIDRVTAFLRAEPGVLAVDTSYKPGKDVVRLRLDHVALSNAGLTVRDVTQAVRIAFDGQVVDELQTVDEKIRYRLQFDRRDRGRMETLRSLVVINKDGLPVPLRSVSQLELAPGEAAIRHYFGRRAVTVSADLDRAVTSVAAVNAALADMVEREGLLARDPSLRLVYGGELARQREALGNIAESYVICALLVFAVLVLLFNSLIQPLLVVAVIPFGFAGVVLALCLHGIPLSMMVLIGTLGLAGVLVNDSLILVDRLNAGRRQLGRRLSDDEIVQAGGERLRPIVITSLTTVAALAPTAYGVLGDDPYISPMVMAMAWGVLLGTLVTLYLLPSLYAIEQDLRVGLARLLRGRD